ncbi:MAG: DnaJ domain-containing protein [Burkholderiales bacterium]
MNNRRNFYRILHVQPEAPLEIIRASYRSLMSKLKAHPDLGGDHEAAVLINQAYAVLSNPEKRRLYDESRRSTKGPARGARGQHADEVPRTPRSGARAAPKADDSRSDDLPRCHFCRTEYRRPPRPSERCGCCASPLVLEIPMASTHVRELFGRRTAPRITKAGNFTLYPSWPHHGYPAQLRDLSPTGLSLLTQYPARNSQILKLDGSFLTGVARVISVRAGMRGILSVHASFLTVEFLTKTGGFVSVRI